jgi:hypothetical protein
VVKGGSSQIADGESVKGHTMAVPGTILRKGHFAFVLHDWPTSDGTLLPASAQLVIARRTVDGDGNICVTDPIEPADIMLSVDGLKAELDALVDETLFAIVSRAAHHLEKRCAFSNDNSSNTRNREDTDR